VGKAGLRDVAGKIIEARSSLPNAKGFEGAQKDPDF
jgi:hypothetical protein